MAIFAAWFSINYTGAIVFEALSSKSSGPKLTAFTAYVTVNLRGILNTACSSWQLVAEDVGFHITFFG
jgi:hypothetical protein